MRKVDRERNGMDFPKLYYPELYLIEGGYKNFYATHPVNIIHAVHCVYLILFIIYSLSLLFSLDSSVLIIMLSFAC